MLVRKSSGGGAGDFKADGSIAMTGPLSTNVGTFTSAVANGVAAKGFAYNTPAYTTTAKLASWANNGAEKAYIQQDGLFVGDLCPAGMGSPGAWAKIYAGGNNGMVFRTYNRDMLYLSGQTRLVQTADDGFFSFSGTSGTTIAAADVAVSRVAASVLGVLKSATAADWGDIKVRTYLADATITAGGTTGAQTINKSLGTVNFAAAASSLVVTNSIVTTSSIIFCTIRTNDATAVIKNVVPAPGSFTINLNAAATAETSVGFIVHN